MFYPRKILKQLISELPTGEIIVITGMRQVGKTTLLKYLYDQIKSKNKVLLDLGNPLERKIFEEEDYNNVWFNLKQYNLQKDQKAYIFLDEVQNLPDAVKVAKYFYDHYSVKFFFTGSSSYYLKNLFSESLAGRKLIFELFPLTFEEFLIFKAVKKEFGTSFKKQAKAKNKIASGKYLKYYDEYIEFGGFPRVVLEENMQRKRYLLGEIFKSYFEIDVKSLGDFSQMSKLRDLILLLVQRVGSKIDITRLASELSLSRETIYNYLSFLEKTYFITLLTRYSKSRDISISGGKKVFFADSGLANFLGKISEGSLLEQSVFQNLRYFSDINYYSKGPVEIDFILDKKTAIEVKRTLSKRDVTQLALKCKTLRLKEYYIVSKNFSAGKNVIQSIDLKY